MQYKKEEVNTRIISAAKSAFLKYGYAQTRMIQISIDSKVPIGNLYRYFPSKEMLFDEVVGEACKSCFKLIDKNSEANLGEGYDSSEKFIFSISEIADDLIDFSEKYNEQLFILLEKSQASKYEDFRENIIKCVSELMKKWFFRVQPMGESLLPEVVTKSLMEGIISILMIVPKDHQKQQMKKLMNFFFYKIEERMN